MQSLSVYIDESGNSGHDMKRPACGVLAGVVIPERAIPKVTHDLGKILDNDTGRESGEVKWSDLGKPNCPAVKVDKAQDVLSTIFQHAARDKDMELVVSALDGTSDPDSPCSYSDAVHYEGFMNFHRRFYAAFLARLLAEGKGRNLVDLNYVFDNVSLPSVEHDKLKKTCEGVSSSMPADEPAFARDSSFTLKDSKNSRLIQVADLLAGMSRDGLDAGAYAAEARLELMQTAADGIAHMYGLEARTRINNSADWQDFWHTMINNTESQLMVVRPKLSINKTPECNAKGYIRSLQNKQHCPAA